MTFEQDKRKYFEYTPDESEWWIKDAPSPQPWFNEALKQACGTTNGKPNLRVEWAGKLLHDITERPQLKYKVTRKIIKGYRYERKDGSIGFVRKGRHLPDAELLLIKNREEMVPVTADQELGRLRWVVERYLSPDELKRQGRFQNLYSPDGEKILRDFPNEGIYTHFFWVQTANHQYRDLDPQVLEAVIAMWHFNVKEWEAWRTLDLIEQENNQTILGADRAREIWAP